MAVSFQSHGAIEVILWNKLAVGLQFSASGKKPCGDARIWKEIKNKIKNSILQAKYYMSI